MQGGGFFRSKLGLGVGERPHFLLVCSVHGDNAITPACLDQGRARLLALVAATHLAVVKHHILGIEVDCRRRQCPTNMHHASRFRAEGVSDCHVWVAALPWWPLGIRCGQTMFDFMAVGKDFDCANAVRKAGAFTPAFFGVELAIREYGALAGDHLVLPLASFTGRAPKVSILNVVGPPAPSTSDFHATVMPAL